MVLRQTLAGLGLLGWVIFLLGLPMVYGWQLAVLGLALGLLCFEKRIDFFSWRWMLCALILGFFLKAIPTVSIEEGHRLLLNEQNQIISPEAAIAGHMPFGFSADAFWQSPTILSRRVDQIGFHRLSEARIGMVNELRYNYHLPVLLYDRDHLPFLMTYIFPKEAVGKVIRFQGLHHFPEHGDSHQFQKADTIRTRLIQDQDVGQLFHIAGGDLQKGIADSPITFELLKTWQDHCVQTLRVVLALSACLAMWVALGGRCEKKQRWRWALLALQVVMLFAYRPWWAALLKPLPGGCDGLTHMAFARKILGFLQSADWYHVWMGVEPVFYYMPGARYVRCVEMMFFGDTYHGFLLFFLFSPFLFFRFFKQCWGEQTARYLLWLFVVPVIHAIGFRMGYSSLFFIRWLEKGYADPMAYGFFVWALSVLCFSEDKSDRSVWVAYVALPLSVALRPNLLLAALYVACLFLIKQARTKFFAHGMAATSVGFLIFMLIPLHNLYFGGSWVWLTTAAGIPENLSVSPSVYGQAFLDLCQGIWNSNAWVKIGHQIMWWNDVRYVWRLPMVYFMLRAAFFEKWDSPIGIFARIGLLLHAQHACLNADFRYTYIAWFFSFVVTVDVLRTYFLSRRKA